MCVGGGGGGQQTDEQGKKLKTTVLTYLGAKT